jgi:Rho family, other
MGIIIFICGATIPIFVVGCKADLRPPPDSPSISSYVKRAQAEQVASEIGARMYRECSALKNEGVDDVFEAATRASMLVREGVVPKRRGNRDDGKGGGCCVVC